VLWSVSGHNIFAVLLKVGITCKIIFIFSDITVVFVTYISFQFEAADVITKYQQDCA